MQLAAAATLVLGAGAAPAADRPGERVRPSLPPPQARHGGPAMYGSWPPAPPAYSRPVNGGPGYVGSDYGLGKPAFTGLGSRPDWGRSD